MPNNASNVLKLPNDSLVNLLSFIAVAVILMMVLRNKAYPAGKLTCNGYILNTYLYVILGITIITINVLLNDRYNFFPEISSWIGIIVLLIVIIAVTLLVINIDPQKTVLKHSIWLIYLFILSLIIYPMYLLSRSEGVLLNALLGTLGISVLITAAMYYNPDLIKIGDRRYLFWALIILIIGQISVPYLAANKEQMISMYYFLAILGVFIFGLYLVYYTKQLKKNSQNCVIPDYIREAVGFIITLVNIFSDIARILLIRKRR